MQSGFLVFGGSNACIYFTSWPVKFAICQKYLIFQQLFNNL